MRVQVGFKELNLTASKIRRRLSQAGWHQGTRRKIVSECSKTVGPPQRTSAQEWLSQGEVSFEKVSPEWKQYREAFHTSTRQLAKIANRAKPHLMVVYHGGNADGDTSGSVVLDRELAEERNQDFIWLTCPRVDRYFESCIGGFFGAVECAGRVFAS